MLADVPPVQRRFHANSFWQTSLPQTFLQPLEILGSAKRDPILDRGNAPCGVKLAQARHGPVRIREPPGKRVSCRQFPNGGHISGTLPQCGFRPCDRFLVATGEKVSKSDPASRPEAMWIQRRKLYRVSELGDRAFGIAEKGFGPSTRKQRPRKIRIKRERPLYEVRSIIEVVRDKDERIPSA